MASNDGYSFNAYPSTTIDRPYATNGLNQYTTSGGKSLSYDGRGNLTGDGTVSYTYNARSELVQYPGGTGIYYDPLDQLFQVTNEQRRLMRSGDDLLTELGFDGVVKRRYVPGPGVDEPVMWYEGAGLGDKRYLMADERGSVVAITDANAWTTAINRYDEYGIPAPGNVGRFQYTGQKWIPDLGLYDYKARIYSPTLGRFLQTDPIGYGDGLNWYDYVGGDPVNNRDPSGLGCFGFCGGVEKNGSITGSRDSGVGSGGGFAFGFAR